jgi:adenylosuccinate synthase
MHNVITGDGKHHCFGQFGAGSLVKGTFTLLSKFMFIFPYSLIGEGNQLQENNLIENPFDYLLIDEECHLITPLNQLVNRITEMLRSTSMKYGTTGMVIILILKFH